jgi:hypothetical protein
MKPLSSLKMTDLASRLETVLREIAANPSKRSEFEGGARHLALDNPSVWSSGKAIRIRYAPEGDTLGRLNRYTATAYLSWLEAGHLGRYRSQKVLPWVEQHRPELQTEPRRSR